MTALNKTVSFIIALLGKFFRMRPEILSKPGAFFATIFPFISFEISEGEIDLIFIGGIFLTFRGFNVDISLCSDSKLELQVEIQSLLVFPNPCEVG